MNPFVFDIWLHVGREGRCFSYKDGKTLANAQKGVEVLERIYGDHNVKLKIRGSKPRINQILSKVN